MNMKGISGLLMATLMIAALPGHAEEGRKEIFRSVVLSGAAAEGKFFVSRDIREIDGGKAVIEITGSGTETVDIDLNGFTLSHSAVGGTKPVVVVSNVLSFTLRNGSLRGADPLLDLLNLTGGAGSQEQAVIEDLKLKGGFDGIRLDNVTNFAIRRNLVVGPGSSGIRITDSTGTALTGLIQQNVIRGVSAGRGIYIPDENAAVTIRDNHIVSVSVDNPDGIHVVHSHSLIVEGNNISGGGSGIVVKEGLHCLVSRNTVSWKAPTPGAFSGLELENTDQCLISDNVFSSAGRHGINLGGGSGSDNNQLERNNCSNNTQVGIKIDSGSNGNTYGRNSLRQNLDTSGCGATASPCATAAVCDKGGGVSANRSFGDNLEDAGGC